jgi:hypothetical protein
MMTKSIFGGVLTLALLAATPAFCGDSPEMGVAKLLFGDKIDQTFLSTSKHTDADVAAADGKD